MKQYIDKSALVAEIEKRRDGLISLSESCPANTAAKSGFYAQAQTLEGILTFLDTLEAKETQYIDKSAIKQKVQEKLLDACERHYEAERALGELVVPQSWKDEAKAAWEEFVWRYQDYELVFKCDMDITKDDLNFDDYETD